MNNIILAIFFIATIGLLSACNTVQGFGKDMQRGGEAVENAAQKNKHSHS